MDQHNRISGFHISGHAGIAGAGEDVLCAFVSSAAYLTANTITDVIGAKAQAQDGDGDMFVYVDEKNIEDCQSVLTGLKLHLEQTVEQYPKNLKVIITEV